MLESNMTLNEMVIYEPSDLEMASLPLDVVVYLKVSLISENKEANYNFIRYLFTDENVKDYFKDYKDTIFFDFDSSDVNQEKYITIFNLLSLMNYANVSDYLNELLQFYVHEADVLIDFFTHDNKAYRLSNLDGIVKLEQMKRKEA